MPDTLTPNVQFTNQTEGSNDNTWGTKTDDNWERADNKFGDLTTVNTTGGTTVLTTEQEIVLAVKVTGQTGLTVAQGTATLVWCDGTDIRQGVPTAEVVADTTPQLGGDLDANGHNIGFDDATGITDDSGNEHIRFQKTAAAVNQLDVTNAATGGSPRIDATGDDPNIDLTLAGKGTGALVARFKQATGLGLLDSDSSHALRLKTSSNLAADRTLDFITGDADRSITLAANLNVSGTAEISGTHTGTHTGTHSGTSSGTNTGDEPTASTSAEGVVELADASEMEAASATDRAVTPGVQHRHPGHPKAGGNFDGTGTPAFRSGDYGMGAITYNGTGNYSLALDTAFSADTYWLTGWSRTTVNNRGGIISANPAGAKTTSSIDVMTAIADDAAAASDFTENGVTFWGDYA